MTPNDNRLAVVTGTTSGIGEVIAGLLLDRGWHVVGLARRAASIQNVHYTHVAVDLGDAPALRAAFATHLAPLAESPALQRLALVNNAADVALYGQLSSVKADDMLRAYAVNCVAPTFLMGSIARHAVPSAVIRIVNVSSAAARIGFPGLGAYGTAKAALRLAGMVMAEELQMAAGPAGVHRDISILSFEPGVVDTPMQRAARSSSHDRLPILSVFKGFEANGVLVPPGLPAGRIVSFIEADGHPPFSEDEIPVGEK